MDRRELLKVGSLALVSTAAGACQQGSAPAPAAAPPAQTAGDGKQRTLNIVFHGPAMITFPDNGKSARLHFLAFHDTDPMCDLPIHLPQLVIENKDHVTCLGRGGESSWSIAGLHTTPDVTGSFSAKDFDQPQPSMERPAGTDWSSLKWVPKLKEKIDGKKLDDHTIASVELSAGSLQAMHPYYEEALGLLWTWQDAKGWKKLENSTSEMAKAERSPFTDQLLYSAPFTGNSVKLQFNPRLAPGSKFQLEFKTDSDEVNLHITSEAPEDAHGGQTKPLKLPCGYYYFLPTVPTFDERFLPYDIEQVAVPPDVLRQIRETDAPRGRFKPALLDPTGELAKRTPKPSCGGMRATVA